MKRIKSEALFRNAKTKIPGGVNSPVRACLSVGLNPLFINKASGCSLYDVDGNSFIDYVGSWGAMILGHSNPVIIDSINSALNKGVGYGAPTEIETELASIIIDSVKSVDLVRMVNSGTEATMSAIRLSRGYTNRNKIIKFDGCYHGHTDSLLVGAGSGLATLSIPGSPGITESVVNDTISLPFNNTDLFVKVINKYRDEIACVIVEPIAGNMGVVKASKEFLEQLRVMTEKTGAILIFDEVMTGFRVALGGAQEIFKIYPDLTCFGKIIGGGLPVGAYGGKLEIMKKISPLGDIYQAGTLSGNPLAMAAGVSTLKEIRKDNFYKKLEIKSKKLFDGLKTIAKKSKCSISINRIGSMLGIFFNDKKIIDYESAKKSNTKLFRNYYKTMLELGIYLAPSQFESIFVSSAHDNNSIDKTISSFKVAVDKLNIEAID